MPLAPGSITITDPDLCHQWHRVLRLRAGEHVLLCDGKGKEAEAEIKLLTPVAATLQVLEVLTVAAEPARDVTLLCAVLKRENMEWIVQKATECGARAITPVITERTVKTGLKMERLGAIAKEAAEQSGRGVIPRIEDPLPFADAVKKASNETNFFLHTTKTSIDLYHLPSTIQHLSLWIGPEGGWSEKEAGMAKENGFTIASLGPLTLRAETAAVIATYLAVHAERAGE